MNSGFSLVIPSYKLLELLNIKELVEMRKKGDEEAEKRNKLQQERKETNTSLDAITKDDFHKILHKASQPIKHEVESDSKSSET